MLDWRWLRWVGPGLIALLAIGAVGSTVSGAGQRPWQARTCADDLGRPADAARASEPTSIAEVRTAPWYRLDPKLDRTGALQGQRLSLGIDGERSSFAVDLPAESFAAGPFGRIVLVGADDESRSTLEAYDVAARCSWPLAQEADVIRRATIDPTGTTIYEMRVDRTTRDDLGIWARPRDGVIAARQVLGPIETDERFGRTYTTELIWSQSGDELAVESCGEMACRVRLLDPLSGRTQMLADPGLGPIVGHQGGVIVAYRACAGLPCPIVALDLVAGTTTPLVEDASIAVLTDTPDGTRLVYELADETGIRLQGVGLDGADATDLGDMPEGFRLHAVQQAADAATTIPPGWVLLSPEARVPASGPRSIAQLRQVPDGTSVQIEEIVR